MHVNPTLPNKVIFQNKCKTVKNKKQLVHHETSNYTVSVVSRLSRLQAAMVQNF